MRNFVPKKLIQSHRNLLVVFCCDTVGKKTHEIIAFSRDVKLTNISNCFESFLPECGNIHFFRKFRKRTPSNFLILKSAAQKHVIPNKKRSIFRSLIMNSNSFILDCAKKGLSVFHLVVQ